MYSYVMEDTGEAIEVDFETHMTVDVAGFITLTGGRRARRVNTFSATRATVLPGNANGTPPPSDAMGCTIHQLADFEEDRVRNGFVGVEFKPDPLCPEFYRVHFGSHQARDEYISHRGLVDKNRTKGAALTGDMLQEAAKNARERWNKK